MRPLALLGMTKRARKLAFVLLAFALIAGGGAAYLLREPLPHFHARRSSLATATVGDSIIDPDYILTPVRVTATSGLAVDLMFRRPRADSGARLPLAVILGGHYTGRKAVDLL